VEEQVDEGRKAKL